MRPPKHLGRFFLLAGVWYAALMAPWPGLERGYASLFRTVSDVFFSQYWFWTDGSVRFLDLRDLKPGDVAPGTPVIHDDRAKDTLMELRSRRAPGTVGYLRASSRYSAYEPTAVLLALILATPVPWRRRGRAIFLGGLLVHLFIAMRLSLTLAAGGFAADKAYALFHPSPFWQRVLERAEGVIADDPTVSFIVPVFIWFLVALWGQRRQETPTPRRPSGPSNEDGVDRA